MSINVRAAAGVGVDGRMGGGEREREEQIKHHCVAIGRDGHSTWCVFVLFFSLEVKVCCYVNGPFTSALDKRKNLHLYRYARIVS